MYCLAWYCKPPNPSSFLIRAYVYDYLIPAKISGIFQHDSALFTFMLFMLSLACHFPNFGLE